MLTVSYAEYHIQALMSLCVNMLNVVMLSVIMLSVVVPSLLSDLSYQHLRGHKTIYLETL
jgi:hypothetical protein